MKELGGLSEAMEKFGLEEGLIVSFGQEDELSVSGKRVRVAPAWKFAHAPPRASGLP